MTMSMSRADIDMIRSIETKSIEEVVVSRKANSVLGASQLGPERTLVRRESGWDSASNSFIEPRPQDEQNESQVQEAYRNYLQSTTGGGGGGGGDHQLMEAYNEMRARCLMLTERVMQLEQVAHGVEAQRDAILDQKEKTVELRDRIHTVTSRLEGLDLIFADGNADVLADAATTINAGVRGYLTRRRTNKGKMAFERWKTEQTTWLKASVCRYLSTQRTLEHAVGAMCLRRTGSLLAEVVFSWRALALKHRPTRTRRMQKVAAVRAMRAERATRKIMLAWRAASTGKFSRKEIKRSYERRKRQAEIRAMDKAEAVGYEPALVTEEMIMEEMNAEAEEQIKSRHLKIQMGERVHTWREGHKSKVGARHRAARLLKDVLAAWAGAVEDMKGDDEADWVAKHQMKLKMRKLFRQLQEDVMAAWRHVAHTHRAAAIRCKRIWKDWLQACFTEFASTVKTRRAARRAVVERLGQAGRQIRAVPFQSWHIYAVEARVWRHAVALYTQVGDRRRAAELVRAAFEGWQGYVKGELADEQQQLADTVAELRAANEKLQAAADHSTDQAEKAILGTETQLEEKEQRAVAAEKEAKETAVALQAAKDELLAMKAQLEQVQKSAESKNQASKTEAEKTAAEKAAAEKAAAEAAALPERPTAGGTGSEVSYEELLLLNRAKWALGEFESAPEYEPPVMDGSTADAELRRLNQIIDIFTSGQRQQVSVPQGVRLPPVKPPSREALPPEDADLKWDEFLTDLDQYDHGRRNSKSGSSVGSRSASNSRPGSRTGSRPSSQQ